MKKLAYRKKRLESLKEAIMMFVDETDPDKVIAGTVDEFYGQEETYCGLWLGAEPGPHKNDVPIWNYYGAEFDTYRKSDTFDTIPEWEEFEESHNIRKEWHDAGTMQLFFNEDD